MKPYMLRVHLEQEDDGRWSAVVPTLPGCATWGDTKEEALSSVREAAQLYLDVMMEDGEPLPPSVTAIEQFSTTEAAVAVAI